MRRLAELREEQDRREREFHNVFRPSSQQEPVFRSKASEIIIFGGKRAGKSVTASSLFSARVTGQPIIASDGTEIPNPWPAPTPEFPMVFWIIGWDTRHVGETIHRLLFQPGQGAGGNFRVIRDRTTGKWRTWDINNAEDRRRRKETKLAEPLIPSRLIEPDSWSWEEKKSNHFNSVKLKNGATIFAYPSSSRNPKQGDAVAGIWVDEDIQFPQHLKEWQDRLSSTEGWFMWSVWPHLKNEALIDLVSRAEMGELEREPQIQKFQLVMTDNPYITDKGKKEALGRMGSEEEIARRNRGDLLTDALSMYQFSTTMHQIQRPIKGFHVHFDYPRAHIWLRDLWLRLNGFPKEWTRYLSIDPSNTRTGVLSWVVPPYEVDGVRLGNLAIAEWELVARRFSATSLATTLSGLMGNRQYEAFIMDRRAGRQTHAGRETNTSEHYASAFRAQKLMSRQSSYSFIPGVDVPETRFRAVRNLMEPQADSGIPSIMIVEERCPETKDEFQKYRKKTEARGETADSVLDQPASPRLFDMMASMEYFAAYIEPMFLAGMAYVDPAVYGTRGSVAYRYAKKILERRRQNSGETVSGVVHLGSGDYDHDTGSDTVSALGSVP